MKIAIQNPDFIFSDQNRNFNGFNFSFFKNNVEIIYVTKPIKIALYIFRMIQLKVNIFKYKYIFNVKNLNNEAGVLVSFNEPAYLNTPPSDFKGLKIWHTMDYNICVIKANKVFEGANVNYLIGYNRHDLYCNYYARYYPKYINKVIALPFGSGNRFKNLISFENRNHKVIALGSVNPVNDPLSKSGTLKEFVKFYGDQIWTHTFRQTIRENLNNLKDIVDSKLPIPPSTKNPSYNPVDELNKYTMFINDEGITNFPPARTYEGIACGCVMVASKNSIYEDLGFVDGINYIAFEKNDLEDFRKKVEYYMTHPDKLKELQKNSLQLAKKYTHKKVAARLYQDIKKIYKEKK